MSESYPHGEVELLNCMSSSVDKNVRRDGDGHDDDQRMFSNRPELATIVCRIASARSGLRFRRESKVALNGSN